MNFAQNKLTKKEWESIEVSVAEDKLEVLNVIIGGFHNVNITKNKTLSLMSFLKIEKSPEMDDYLFNTYFSKKILELYKKYDNHEAFKIKIQTNAKIKTIDSIRIKNNNTDILNQKIYEFIVIELIENLFEKFNGNIINKNKWIYYYFTLSKINKNNFSNVNKNITKIIVNVLKMFEKYIELDYLIYNSVDFIEKNENIIKYSDITLYDHQKKIFTALKIQKSKNIETPMIPPRPKLILYIAPTGTGKTLTPIGLSEEYKVIYVCASRHVGLALAKSSISINKKIAFAFGCSSADDIRLHYFAAKEYTKNKRSGGIGKVDNSVGDKVEIIICDVKSYLPAMYYMLAFFKKEEIITYFDEPTIFLDYKFHELHEIIHKNWKDNLIPTVVLSSATLPKNHEIPETIADFKKKFDNAEIITIMSYDCKKTIPIVDSSGFISMPHYIGETYEEIKDIALFCSENPTFLRYLDLGECIKFIRYVEENNCCPDKCKIERNFSDINDVNMENIKKHYLNVLQNLNVDVCESVINRLKQNIRRFIKQNETIDPKGNRIRKIQSMNDSILKKSSSESVAKPQSNPYSNNVLTRTTSVQDGEINRNSSLLNNRDEDTSISQTSSSLPLPPTPTPTPLPPHPQPPSDFGIYLTTKDSYTMTDGPTLFLAKDIEKIARFCICQSNIPTIVMDNIMEKISINNELSIKINNLEKELDDIREKKIDKPEDLVDGKHHQKSKKKDTEKIKINEDKDVGAYKISFELEKLYSCIKSVSINEIFIPNKISHIKKWCEDMETSNVFTSDISEELVIKIMSLEMDSCWKILLLLGIGVFSNHNNNTYNEIMKELAETQRLYLIISNSDYIYGTNYQFCHLYIGKDMEMTQEKIIQSMGRVGRGNIQQNYSIRFRDNENIKMLFSRNSYKPEVENMNIIFTSKNISYSNEEEKYIILEDDDIENEA